MSVSNEINVSDTDSSTENTVNSEAKLEAIARVWEKNNVTKTFKNNGSNTNNFIFREVTVLKVFKDLYRGWCVSFMDNNNSASPVCFKPIGNFIMEFDNVY